MKRILLFLLLAPALLIAAGKGNKKIILTKNGSSTYKIILASDAGHWDSLAAFELQKYISDISGARLEITDAMQNPETGAIFFKKDPSLKTDGFRIYTKGNKIYFTGGMRRGNLNAVSSFLEKYLRCRMYTAEVKVIPKNKNISLPEMDFAESPVFEYRDINYKESWNKDFSYWHKLDSDPESKKVWGLFVHTFNRLVPPDKYFKEHPEYYSELNGIRVADGQLCLTNPDVLKVLTEELRKRINENPNAKIWSVSQNDNFSNCRCPECSRLDSIEGSPSGSLLSFVNKVARQFPDKTISTLAYQYTRKAPKTIKPEKNVNIVLCSIECNRSKPLETDPTSAGFVNDIKEWSRISDNIMIWDYVVQFKNTASPFPNFHVLQPNIKLFARYGVKMMFQQGAGACTGYEFGELRNYIIAKLLWNPDVNVSAVMNDFLNGYYGKGGKYIRKYIDIMTASLIKSGAPLLIYGNPISAMQSYLTPALMKRYNKLFDEAERAVRNNADILKRVKIARLPLKYAMLEQAKVIINGKNGIVVKERNGNYIPNPAVVRLLNQFELESRLPGRMVINESGVTAEDYVNTYRNLLTKTMKNPLGLNMPVTYVTKPSDKYPANGIKSLTDGLRGLNDYNYNWIGYEADDMDVIIDLQKVKTVKKVSVDFLQDNNSWIFMPRRVEIGVSDDGKNFTPAAVINNTEPEEKTGAFTETFAAELQNSNARYIRVKGINMKVCPKWHKGYPGKAWIFADEVVIE